jgi:peptidoglycan/LPS O-acetylase OafA/YrhL
MTATPDREFDQSPSPVGSSATRLPALDGLRAWVLLIVLHHFGDFSGEGPLIQYVFLFASQLAFVGLDVFFVLSGFLITRILLDTRHSQSYYRTFFARRVLRVFPVYYGFLIAYFLVVPRVVSWDTGDVGVTLLQHLAYWTYLQNFWAGFNYFGEQVAASSFLHSTIHIWSLSVEEQFYVLWPVVVRFCTVPALKWVCVACVLAAPVVRIVLVLTLGDSTYAAYALTPARMDGLALGALAAIVSRERGGLVSLRRWSFPAGLVGLAVLAMLFYRGDEMNGLFLTLGLTASVYSAAALFLATLMNDGKALWHRVLCTSPLRRIGRYSYAIYVIHFPLGYSLNRSGIVARAWFHEWAGSAFLAELIYSTTIMALSVGAAAVSWAIYEYPILRLARYLPYRASAPGAPSGFAGVDSRKPPDVQA